VHEYGGGAHLVSPSGDTVFFVDDNSRRLYRQDAQTRDGLAFGAPEAIGPDSRELRYADMTLSADGKVLYAVVEDHRDKVGIKISIVETAASADSTISLSRSPCESETHLDAHTSTHLSYTCQSSQRLPTLCPTCSPRRIALATTLAR